jgi:AAA+ superfamily predicted ATPase
MAYTPIVVTTDNLRSTAFRNIYNLLDNYKGSSTVNAVNNELDCTTPSYNIWPIQHTNNKRTMSGKSRDREFNVQIDFAVPSKLGWKAVDDMVDNVEKSLYTENDNLKTARLDWTNSTIQSIDPLLINDQQMFVISMLYSFKVLI